MFTLMQIWILAAFVCYRFFVLSLPIFEPVRQTSFATNLSVGLTADLTLAFILIFGLEVAKLAKRPALRGLVGLVSLATIGIFVFCLGSNLRYFEHFGMSVRPYHIASLQTGGFQGAALGIALESWRIQILLAAPPLLGCVALWRAKWLAFSWVRCLTFTLIALAVNATSIQLRYFPGVHVELRHHFINALKENQKRYDYYVKANGMEHKKTDFIKVRELFSQDSRRWVEEQAAYPLWQEKIATGSQESNETVQQLRSFLAAEKPKNVVVVLLESIIADFVSALSHNKKYRTPNLDKVIANNLTFTEMIAAGALTKDGQIATLCSLYTTANFPLMAVSPLTRAKCLPDMFKKRGYDTAFFHPADNHFDNKQTFYQFHSTRHIVDENDFPASTAKGGWGYSDHSLFTKALNDFTSMPEPFFATILTLTNHAPFTVPADAPSELFGDDIHARIVSYVDWAFGQFYDEFFQQHPHSVMLILSDQGISYGERVDTQSNDYRDVRKQFRMPFVIAAPDLPKSLRGKTFDHLVSNVDVAPTLANLLSFDEPNQFMGVDMFSRSTPIYTNYFDRFLKIVESDQKPMLQPVKPSLIEILTQLGHNNQYMPAESS